MRRASSTVPAAPQGFVAIPPEERLTSSLRPGVPFPDWSMISSASARAALVAMLEAAWNQRAWLGYTPAEDAVRRTMLELYKELGHAPPPEKIARRSGTAPERVRSLLNRLAGRDLVVLESGQIVGAYPLSDRPTEHRVCVDGQPLQAMCAIDALGVGDMYGRDVEIRSRCRSCDAPVSIATSDQGRAVADVQPATAVVWAGIRHTDGCAANSLCTVIAFFCDDAHLAAWRVEHHPERPGFRLSISDAFQVGRAIFGPVLAPPVLEGRLEATS